MLFIAVITGTVLAIQKLLDRAVDPRGVISVSNAHTVVTSTEQSMSRNLPRRTLSFSVCF
jgi:hypothetical protein